MTGVRIDTLRVNAFRGISSKILFDFTSPLTVIFAPNGTGKTTMCEAAEWLLTGQVERLRDKGHFDQESLQPKFSLLDQETSVDSKVYVSGKALHLKRISAGGETQARIGLNSTEEGEVVGLNEWLRRLAPAAAAEDAHHLRAISLRQSWLRGTRFLSAEALAILVDSDDGTIERRKDVFADLLGIRHLLEAEKLVGRYIAEASAYRRTLSQVVGAKEEEISLLKEDLHSALPLPESAASEVAVAEQILEIPHKPSRESAALATRIEALDVERRRRQHILSSRREAIEDCAANWPRFAELNNRLLDLNESYSTLSEKAAKLTEQEQVESRLMASAEERSNALERQIRHFDSVKSSLSQAYGNLIDSLHSRPNMDDQMLLLTLDDVLERHPQGKWPADVIGARRLELRAALDGAYVAGEVDRRASLLREQLGVAVSRQISDMEISQLEKRVEHLHSQAERAQQYMDSALGPLARLKSAGREMMEHQHLSDIQCCPLCNHDWKSADQLQRAMIETLAAVPELERVAAESVVASREALRREQSRLDDARRHVNQVRKLRQELTGLERHADMRKRELAKLGVDGVDSLAALRALEKELDTASALSEFMRLYERLPNIVSDLPGELVSREMPLRHWGRQIEDMLGAQRDKLREKLVSSQEEFVRHTMRRDELRADYAGAKEAISGNREEHAQNLNELAKLKELWRRAAPNAIRTRRALAEARRWCAREQALLEDVASRTIAAQGAWNVEVRKTRLDTLMKDVTPSRSRLEHLNGRLSVARQMRERLQESYFQVSNLQINDLSRVVNPLFARMHANHVFDKIRMGGIEDPLRWLADADSKQLDPGKDFSQGQRQDLALALFLARARSLGGTFFLDEPVVHLDDLNRVGLLDIFRATVLESSKSLNLVVTTASRPLLRHFVEKFSQLAFVETPSGLVPPLRVLELDGNGRTGISLRSVYPTGSEI